MKIVLALALIPILVMAVVYGFSFVMKDVANMYARSKKPADEYRNGLLAALSDLDQQIAEAEALIQNANMPVPEWVRCSEQLAELEAVRADVEGKLRAGQ